MSQLQYIIKKNFFFRGLMQTSQTQINWKKKLSRIVNFILFCALYQTLGMNRWVTCTKLTHLRSLRAYLKLITFPTTECGRCQMADWNWGSFIEHLEQLAQDTHSTIWCIEVPSNNRSSLSCFCDGANTRSSYAPISKWCIGKSWSTNETSISIASYIEWKQSKMLINFLI